MPPCLRHLYSTAKRSPCVVHPPCRLASVVQHSIREHASAHPTRRTADTLSETIKFDHGYTRDSGPAGHFVRVLEALDAADQRRFLRFVTGSPRLPPGGIAALQVCCPSRMMPQELQQANIHIYYSHE